MFGIGYQEMLVLMVAALIIFGPGKLPEVAGQLGRAVRDFRRMSAELTGEFEKSISVADDVKRTVKSEVTGMKSQVTGVTDSVKKDLGKTTTSAPKKATVAGSASKPTGSAKSKVTIEPVATKADPLADVSVLDDDLAAPPSNGAETGDRSAALARARRRRAAAGYNRRSS